MQCSLCRQQVAEEDIMVHFAGPSNDPKACPERPASSTQESKGTLPRLQYMLASGRKYTVPQLYRIFHAYLSEEQALRLQPLCVGYLTEAKRASDVPDDLNTLDAEFLWRGIEGVLEKYQGSMGRVCYLFRQCGTQGDVMPTVVTLLSAGGDSLIDAENPTAEQVEMVPCMGCCDEFPREDVRNLSPEQTGEYSICKVCANSYLKEHCEKRESYPGLTSMIERGEFCLTDMFFDAAVYEEYCKKLELARLWGRPMLGIWICPRNYSHQRFCVRRVPGH
eukprot:PhF_6_TR26073/c0_g1_i1/m.36775